MGSLLGTLLLPISVAAQAPPIDLAVFDRVDISDSMRRAVLAETEEVLARLGARVVWRLESEQFQIYNPGDEIQVILSSSRPEKWQFSPDAMGAVVPIGPARRNVVFVFPVEVAGLLHLPSLSKLSYHLVDGRRFAKALGRVIAHELVHAIAPDHPHANNGIMLGTHKASSLLDPELRVDASCRAAFRAGLSEFGSNSRTRHFEPFPDRR